jgi:putative hydrolase of the HAD superfamily
VKKPNPIIFEYALDLSKAKKENSIMIGILLKQIFRSFRYRVRCYFFNERNVEAADSINK